MPELIKMVKGDEELPVHPGAVENYKRAGWVVWNAGRETSTEQLPEPVAESIPDLADAVAVETAQPMPTEKATRPKKAAKKK